MGCPQVWRAAGCEPGEAAAALMAAGQRAASALAPGGQNRGARMAWQEFRKVVRALLASLADCQPGEPPTAHMYGHIIKSGINSVHDWQRSICLT